MTTLSYFATLGFLMLWIKLAQSLSWLNGWYLETGGKSWALWDDSWLTWTKSSECTSWEKYMYLDTTTKMWTLWPSGQYYDFTYQICRNWDDKWNESCQYQTKCFAWDSTKIFDMESMSWVSAWNSPKSNIISLQYSIASIWRLPDFYVDPLSSDIIELGTIRFPYKSMRAVSSDIINNFSHKNIDITIYLKENTNIYVSDYTTYFINITSVKITSYSTTSSS